MNVNNAKFKQAHAITRIRREPGQSYHEVFKEVLLKLYQMDRGEVSTAQEYEHQQYSKKHAWSFYLALVLIVLLFTCEVGFFFGFKG